MGEKQIKEKNNVPTKKKLMYLPEEDFANKRIYFLKGSTRKIFFQNIQEGTVEISMHLSSWIGLKQFNIHHSVPLNQIC